MNRPLTRAQHRALGTWVFGGLFFLFFVGVFIFAPEALPEFKQRMLAIASALLAGLFGYFLSGDLRLEIQSIKSRFGEVGVKATGGIAAFVLVLVWWLSPLAPITPETPPFPPPSQGGNITVGRDVTGGVIQTGPGSIYYGGEVSAEQFKELAGELGVTEAALKSFFKILEREQVPPEDLDSTLREIATHYKELDQRLATFTSEDPAVMGLKKEARGALEAGKFERAEVLLNKAKTKDIEAANAMQEAAHQRLLSAAASAAELGTLKHTELAYVDAAEYYREAASLLPKGEELVRAEYLNQEGLYWLDAGRYREAQEPLERALAIREAALGPKHPDIAVSLNNLAELYRAQGQYAKAEPLYEQALAILEAVLGPKHPDVAVTRNNLAELYRAQGRYEQAEPLYKRALAILEEVLEVKHPRVAVSLNNLAGLYYTQGQYVKAEPLYKRALAISEAALGADHPHTMTVRKNYEVLNEDSTD